MSKRFIVPLVAAVALVLASTASAAITITQAPAGPGYQNLSPWTCNGRTYYLTPHPGTDQNGNPIAQIPGSGSPIRLGFGWFANNTGGLKQFFANTSGSVTITGTDTFNDTWARSSGGSPFLTTQGIQWTNNEPNVGTLPNGNTVKGVSGAYRGVLAFAPGTYTMTVTFFFEKDVNDGWYTYTAPSTLGGTPCTFTVVA